MALFRCSSGGGGAPTLSQLLYNSSKTLLGSITTYNGSYTATEDCVMYGYGKGVSNNYSPMIYIDGVVSVLPNASGSAITVYIGYSSTSLAAPDTYGMFIPKGATITCRNRSEQIYNLEFYSLD